MTEVKGKFKGNVLKFELTGNFEMTEFHLAYPTIETQDPEDRLITG